MKFKAAVSWRRFLSVAMAVELLCFNPGCTTPPHSELARATAPSGSFQKIQIGLCEDYPEESRSLARARRDLELLRQSGLSVLRIAFGWDAIEAEPGRYDWSFWDDFVRMAVDEYRVQLIPYVCYTPRWASLSQGDDFWQQPPRDNQRFAEFMRRMVTRYHSRIHSWEIWNEPDNPAYWRGSPDQFADLLVAGSRAVHETDPTATVVMGGLAWDLQFLETILARPGAVRDVNIINLHNYYETWANEPLEAIPDYIARASEILQRHGQSQSIWMAEVGYSSYRKGAEVSGQYHAYYRNEHTPAAQAESLFRALTLVLASGKVSLVAWYRINDLPSAQEVIGDANNRHLGVLDEAGRPKPGLRALQFFDSLFTDGFHSLDSSVRITKSIGSPAEVHVFERPDGKIVAISWLRSYAPALRSTDVSGDIEDSQPTDFTISLPFPVSGSANAFDETGHRLGTIPVSIQRDGSSTVRLSLREGEVRVAMFDPRVPRRSSTTPELESSRLLPAARR